MEVIGAHGHRSRALRVHGVRGAFAQDTVGQRRRAAWARGALAPTVACDVPEREQYQILVEEGAKHGGVEEDSDG